MTLQSIMISTASNPTESLWNSLIPIWQTRTIVLLKQSVWKVMYAAQIQCRESRMLLTNGQHPCYFLVEAIPWFIYIKLSHRANNHGMYADGFHNSMIDIKDGHIPLPLISCTCTTLRHAFLEWQNNKSVDPKASKSELTADRPDRSIYINYKNDIGKNASCCAAMGLKLLTLSDVADIYTFLMDTWNTLPESYKQRVYIHTLATVTRQIQPVENPTPAVVISMEAARVANDSLLD